MTAPNRLPNIPAQEPETVPQTVIRIANGGKMYRLYDRPVDRLKQMLWSGRRMYSREFWALRNISLEVRKGEMVGIIGRNGSGKSTLLQLIAGTLSPNEGDLQVHGRVAALLELGSGFHPNYTGRENVFMNGSILGLSLAEMKQRFDQIAAFADIGDFMDRPIKIYSSGMVMRLAFAVQASIEPDILIIDEALAVGDVFFRQKCYRWLETLRARGTAILLVSHSMPDIEQFCQRALLLNKGTAIFCGAASEAVKRYYLIEQQERLPMAKSTPASPRPAAQPPTPIGGGGSWPAPEAFLDIRHILQVTNEWARCTGVALCDQQGQPCQVFPQGETANFYSEFELIQDIEVPIGGIMIQRDNGMLIHGKNSLQHGSATPHAIAKGSLVRFCQSITLEIAPGAYTFEVGLASISYADSQQIQGDSQVELNQKFTRICHLAAAGQFSVIFSRRDIPGKLLHYGAANLPGACEIMVAAQPERGQ